MGELAAFATSICWSLTSVQFTLAGRRIGSTVVNRVRLVMAVVFLSLAHLVLHGQPWPIDAELFRWGWLGLSGTIGLVIGDTCLFQAFVLIGPRRSMLIMTSVPVISTLLAWVWLGEALQSIEIAAILLTVSGIAWVVAERQPEGSAPAESQREYALGILLGLGGAFGQALGLVTAKQGLVGDFPSLSAALIRMVTASVAIWLLTLFQRQAGRTLRSLRDRRAIGLLVLGTLTGPFAGVWLSMAAVQNTAVGIASTLMALSPIMLIPLERWVFDERVSPRAVIGTVIALAGSAMIFLT
jgi:drug/metabolite transporter (DMT)-like permease